MQYCAEVLDSVDASIVALRQGGVSSAWNLFCRMRSRPCNHKQTKCNESWCRWCSPHRVFISTWWSQAGITETERRAMASFPRCLEQPTCTVRWTTLGNCPSEDWCSFKGIGRSHPNTALCVKLFENHSWHYFSERPDLYFFDPKNICTAL